MEPLGLQRVVIVRGGPRLEARELFASMGFAPAVAEVNGLLGSPEAAAFTRIGATRMRTSASSQLHERS
jgi:hypothetical protein